MSAQSKVSFSSEVIGAGMGHFIKLRRRLVIRRDAIMVPSARLVDSLAGSGDDETIRFDNSEIDRR
jgi:hypothetical protein